MPATSRPAAPTDFEVIVEGVGRFVFGKRNLSGQFKIEAEYKRLTEGMLEFTSIFGQLASKVADLKVLAVEVPDGWDPDELDPMEEESYAKLEQVWGALRDKENTFRGRVPPPPPGAGEGA